VKCYAPFAGGVNRETAISRKVRIWGIQAIGAVYTAMLVVLAAQAPAQAAQVGGGNSLFQSTVQFPATSSLRAGQSIQGDVVFANRTGALRAVRLSLSVSHAYATMTSPSGAVPVPSGNPPPTPFTITFARNSPLGPARLEVTVVDSANPGTAYSVGALTVTVNSPPAFYASYRWVIIGVALILGILLALWWRRARRAAADVRSLYAILHRNGERMGAELKAPGKSAGTFRFVIRDEDEPTARLDYPRPEDSAYSVRRGKGGQVNVVTPTGEQFDITVGTSGELMSNGLQLAFRDTKQATVKFRSNSNGSRTNIREPASQLTDADEPAVPYPLHPPPRDEWL
jgi:hypothetical protein